MIHHHKIRKCVPPEIKSEILEKLKMPGSVVSVLAKDYNISHTTIYGWQAQERLIKEDASNDASPHFIEMAVVEQAPKSSSLQKASLTFNDFSFSLEGKLPSGVLLQIMKILEASSC